MFRTFRILRVPSVLKAVVVDLPKCQVIRRTIYNSKYYCSQNEPALNSLNPSIENYVNRIVDDKEANFPVKPHIRNDLARLWSERCKLLEDIAQLEKELQDYDKEMKSLAEEEKLESRQKIEDLESQILRLIVPSTSSNVQSMYLEVTAGVGGQEAMLFAAELFQMYTGYLEFCGWNYEVVEVDNSEIGGMRHGSISVSGRGSYEVLKLEAGVHRVQRVPKTEKSGRLHTSTVSVAVLAQPSEVEVNINPKDLKIETKRASGAGGQHVNTTDSAVRIVHLPTGIAVECQSERSQIQNRSKAIQKLRAKLYQSEIEKQELDTRTTRKLQVGSSFRSEKIRTYNFPQDRVTDHRIGKTLHNLKGFLEGGDVLNGLVQELIEKKREEDLKSFLSSLD
ncbi:Hypothetical predicted protein [Cloeon dipterum]|uniref:Prokaryotic-type class I peptide chain release factors domain-containing protein n=1 Tax=Cloeon dipterum TaxID=197152 RepID=A0A8S1DLW6_9INSE|nr:Hypothetical predicted protein [Cloeon dipterum]